jgi:predicted Ser/Thr protein kinase
MDLVLLLRKIFATFCFSILLFEIDIFVYFFSENKKHFFVYFLGVGGFGKVFRGYYRGSEVAVKAARGDANESPELTKDRVLQVMKLFNPGKFWNNLIKSGKI